MCPNTRSHRGTTGAETSHTKVAAVTTKTPLRHAVIAALATAALFLAGCGNPVAEAEESATVYFSAPITDEWQLAYAASTGEAQSRAEYYVYLQTIPDLPSGAQFNSKEDAAGTSAQFTELTEIDGVLTARGELVNGPPLNSVEFLRSDEGVKVADYAIGKSPDGSELMMADIWATGESLNSVGDTGARVIAGRISRSLQAIEGYEWAVALLNNNAWPLTVTSVTVTPLSGEVITGTPNLGSDSRQSMIRVPTEVPSGRSVGLWISQPARALEGGGAVAVTLTGAGVSQVLTLELPTLNAPPSWQIR